MHLEKGARARGRIGKWCVTIVMVKATMPADLDSMYALAHLEFQNQDLDATCAEDSVIKVRTAHRPVGDTTHPPQEKDKKDKDLEKERATENGAGSAGSGQNSQDDSRSPASPETPRRGSRIQQDSARGGWGG